MKCPHVTRSHAISGEKERTEARGYSSEKIMKKVVKATKRKSTVVSSQTYRKMVEEALESSPACALDLHGIYEALAERYEQYRKDSVEVDWRNSIRHCLSINDNFIRVLPEAIRLTFFPTDPENPIFYHRINDETIVSRSFWTTAKMIEKHHWKPFIMNTSSNVRKAINMNVITDASEILPPLPSNSIQSHTTKHKYPSVKSTFTIQPVQPGEKLPISKRTSVTDMLVSEWIDPSSFLDIAPPNPDLEFHSQSSSPLAVVSGNQAALFNIAVIEEDDRIIRMRQRLKNLQQTMPNVLGPLKVELFNVRIEKEPAALPSPLKEVTSFNNNGNRDSPQMVSLPPIFNHPI